ncbi:hypothetical protein BJX66DRAFT_1729 [Aspergillus keveii]|uniref:Uncharacterized protein n=1 Tax=Aspergillus keveii TaxID=714993 RepID=A0ABR4GPX2_9EURO
MPYLVEFLADLTFLCSTLPCVTTHRSCEHLSLCTSTIGSTWLEYLSFLPYIPLSLSCFYFLSHISWFLEVLFALNHISCVVSLIIKAISSMFFISLGSHFPFPCFCVIYNLLLLCFYMVYPGLAGQCTLGFFGTFASPPHLD